MSADPVVGGITVVLTWILVALLIATLYEENEGHFFYPGKNKGERGVTTTCRWAFITTFAPLILPTLLGFYLLRLLTPLIPKVPDATRDLVKWMIKKK